MQFYFLKADQQLSRYSFNMITYCFFVVEVGNSGSNDYSPLMDKFQLASFAFAGHSKFCVNQSPVLFFCFGSGEGWFK
jgi:hypothetical protein